MKKCYFFYKSAAPFLHHQKISALVKREQHGVLDMFMGFQLLARL
jgi:hypothetical protein